MPAANFSEDRVYRYTWIEWVDIIGNGRVMFLMLNPSTADEEKADPTVRRCIGFTKAWGGHSLVVTNVFPLRSTDPAALLKHEEPESVRQANEWWIRTCAKQSMFVVAAYGAHPAAKERGPEIVRKLLNAGITVTCLGLSKDGSPRHPLYVKKSAELLTFCPEKEGCNGSIS